MAEHRADFEAETHISWFIKKCMTYMVKNNARIAEAEVRFDKNLPFEIV